MRTSIKPLLRRPLANILNLSDFMVQRVEEADHDYHVYAEVSNPPGVCTACGSDRLIGHGRNEQVIRDLPTHGKRLVIYVDTRRWRCQSCGKTFMEALPAVNAKREMTDRLVKWIGQQSLKRTFASIADDTGLDEKTIRNIFRDYINELEAEFRFETPKWMGIDEIHLIKPRCVISNIRNNTIIDMLPNRDKKTVVNYLYNLQGKSEVQYVAMDMWTPYRDAVAAMLPDARIVIDKFHVVRMANDALEKVRKSLREQLTPKQRRGLMHADWCCSSVSATLMTRKRCCWTAGQRTIPSWGLRTGSRKASTPSMKGQVAQRRRLRPTRLGTRP